MRRSSEQSADVSSPYRRWPGFIVLRPCIILTRFLLNVSGCNLKIVTSIVWSYQIRVFTLDSWQTPLLDGMRVGVCRFLDLLAKKTIVWHYERVRYHLSKGECQCLLLCNPSRCIFQVSQRLCSEVCKCSNPNISMRWDDEWAGLICGDSNLDNTPLLSVYGGNKYLPFKPRWSGLYNYYM